METKPKFILVPDTNILWKKEKDSVANQEFEDFWNEVSSNYLIELVIPEVVEGELIFQHLTSAINRWEKIKENLNELNSIAQKEFQFRPKKEDVKKNVEIKFKKWLSQHKGRIYKTPLEKIDWKATQKKAILKVLPFKNLEKKPKSEKTSTIERTRDDDGGFKDSLIFETVKDIHSSLGKKFVLFISNDNFLREALEKQLGSFENYFSHESLDETLSTIKLKEEKLTKAFATQIQKRAHNKFFEKNNPKTIWYKDNIPKEIVKKYPDYLKPQIKEGTLTGGLFGFGAPLQPEWNSSSEGQWFLGQTIFNKREEDNTYHWITPLFYHQQFNKVNSDSGKGPTLLTGLLSSESPSQQTPSISEKLLKAKFNVHWHSEVKVDKRFYKLKLDDIQGIGQDLDPIKDDSP